MKKLLLFVVMLFILSSVNAVLIDTSNHYSVQVSSVQLRSDSDSFWGNSIDAEDNDAVDIRSDIFLDYYNYYGTSYYPYDWIDIFAEIYGYDNGWNKKCFIELSELHFSLLV